MKASQEARIVDAMPNLIGDSSTGTFSTGAVSMALGLTHGEAIEALTLLMRNGVLEMLPSGEWTSPEVAKIHRDHRYAEGGRRTPPIRFCNATKENGYAGHAMSSPRFG